MEIKKVLGGGRDHEEEKPDGQRLGGGPTDHQ
jgi:hypothetical protein